MKNGNEAPLPSAEKSMIDWHPASTSNEFTARREPVEAQLDQPTTAEDRRTLSFVLSDTPSAELRQPIIDLQASGKTIEWRYGSEPHRWTRVKRAWRHALRRIR